MVTQKVVEQLLIVLMVVGHSTAQVPSVWKPQDVISYFCSRWYHQSVIKNDILYLYGGVQTFNVPELDTSSTNNTLGYNPFMLQLDLRQSWDWQTNISWRAFETTPNPRTGASVRPAMVRGSLFHGTYGSPEVWTYGGTIFRGNETSLSLNDPEAFNDQSNIYPLWSFDNNTNTWDQFDIGTLTTPSYGSSAEAPDQGLAFYLHGRTDNGTSMYTKNAGDVQTLLDGMIIIDLLQHTSRNISIAGMKDSQPRLGGGLQYIPGLGQQGLLVALGGKVLDGLQPVTSQSRGRLLSFDDVDVFDIASYAVTKGKGTWHTQSTSGDVPPARIDFCTVLAPAPDNSSHNIFMYGGWDPTGATEKYYDDMYVLSLPSFTWLKMFEGESPRYGHTCHLAAGRQLLTIGGSTQHGNVTDTCDWEAESVAVMDLPTMTWGSIFSEGYRPFELSNSLVDKLGGTTQGNATVRAPANGWASKEFEKVMRTSRIYSNLNGTLEVLSPFASTTPGMSIRARSAIIASVTIVGLAILACSIWFVFLRRKNHETATDATHPDSELELPCENGHEVRVELSSHEKPMYEMSGEGYMHEAMDGTIRAEADRSNIAPVAVELPASNFGSKEIWEKPLIHNLRATITHGNTLASNHEHTSDRKGDGDMVRQLG